MDDLDKYIEKRKRKSPDFAASYDKGYEQFRIGALLKEARIKAHPLISISLKLSRPGM